MKIGLDIMGGDFAPDNTILGAILAFNELPASDRIVLIGDKKVIVDKLNREDCDPGNFDIVHTSEVIGMSEHPIKAFNQKKDSSLYVGFKMLKMNELNAFSSAGNTGALLVGSIYSINTIPGIIRPCTSAVLPKENGGISVLLDVGTNPDPKPDVMFQFAILGSLYAKEVHGISNPRVGLLNIGKEEEKGNMLAQYAYKLLKDSKEFNFIGNIEGRDLLEDKCDVIVCDGFTGNVVLKQMEAMYLFLMKRGFVDDYIKKFNYENIGGTPILGINSSVMLGHGISSPLAIKNMLLHSKLMYEVQLTQKIQKALKKYPENNKH